MARENRHEWIAQPLLDIEGAFIRTMFGCRSVYGRGMLLLVLADGEEPWSGTLFPVDHAKQPEVIARWPRLRPHAVLPKWLYLSEHDDEFESLARELVREICQGNPLLGVIPPPKKRKASKKAAPKTLVEPTKRRRVKIEEGEQEPPPPPSREQLRAIPPHLR